MEKEYRILRANFENLKSQFDSLKKEKQSLLIQLQKLHNLLEQPHGRRKDSKSLAGISTDRGSDNGDTNRDYEVSPSCLREGLDHRIGMDLDDDKSKNMGCTMLNEEPNLLNMGEHVDGSPENWSRVDACGLFDQSCSDSHWWDFWS
ncbi:hypothetical protein L1049_017021 [Liquidambar formosana]|uniref:Leucine zipper homeobox-associated domain-containing protein n=1 Tax=Liquidambar formosana TaxID=63359 RepID=A0AAP0X3V4_LIQFO